MKFEMTTEVATTITTKTVHVVEAISIEEAKAIASTLTGGMVEHTTETKQELTYGIELDDSPTPQILQGRRLIASMSAEFEAQQAMITEQPIYDEAYFKFMEHLDKNS